jgi:UDP-2,3-diacylglucosamine pyrophosphatase LpxH
MDTHVLVVSDIHIGSPVSRSSVLLRALRLWEFKVLLIDGDLFNDLAFTRLTKDDWRLLSYLRKLTGHRHGVRVVWARGNHDDPIAEVVAHILGIELVEEYEWEEGSDRYIALHGHQFDSFIQKHPAATNVACAIYFTLQLLDRRQRLSRQVKRISKRWLRLDREVGTKALAFGEERNRNVICGHTHHLARREGRVVYYNSGCWTDIPSSLLAVDRKGVRAYEIGEDGECREARHG